MTQAEMPWPSQVRLLSTCTRASRLPLAVFLPALRLVPLDLVAERREDVTRHLLRLRHPLTKSIHGSEASPCKNVTTFGRSLVAPEGL